MLRSTARAALTCLVVFAAFHARADEDLNAVPVPSTAPMDYGPLVALDESVEAALQKNFAIRLQRYPIIQAQAQEEIEKAAYLPTFDFQATKNVQQQPASSSSLNDSSIAGVGPYTKVEDANAKIVQNVMTGGTVTAGYDQQRTQTNSAFATLNPSYDGTASITIAQPLLQGAGVDYYRSILSAAALGTKIARYNLKSSVLTVIYNVETAYFNLVYAREQYKVAQDTLKLAQQLYDENSQKRKTGVVTDLDVLQAKVGVATAETTLIQDRQFVQNSEDALQQYMGVQQFNNNFGSVAFPEVHNTSFTFERSYKLARDNGPNLAVVNATIEQFKLAALRAKRNNLPQLNVQGGVGYTSVTISDYSAVTKVWNGDGYNWTAGVTLSVPWGMRANKALYRQAQANIESEQVTFDQLDQQLVVQVRAAVRAVGTNTETLKAATQQAELANQQYGLQKAKFDAGLATSYDVLQAQNQLETSRVAELQAQVNLRIAVADVHFLEGTSLEHYKVDVPQ